MNLAFENFYQLQAREQPAHHVMPSFVYVLQDLPTHHIAVPTETKKAKNAGQQHADSTGVDAQLHHLSCMSSRCAN